MKKNYLKSIIVLLLLNLQFAFGQSAPSCPTINATAGGSGTVTSVCGGGCATLNATVVPVNQTNTYSIQSIAYVPYSFSTGTIVSAGTDDVWSPIVNLGFSFCYFGNAYTKCIIGSNGQLSFNTALANGFDNWVISTALPNTVDMPGNTICAAFRDIDPTSSGNIYFAFYGNSPCRSLVISWDSIPLFDDPGPCSGKAWSSFQLVLHENTNYIDVFIKNSTSCSGWNSGYGIVGIQNAAGTTGYSPPLRNYPTTWTATNEGWRFVPTGVPSYTVSWAGPGGFIGNSLTQVVCPASTSNYTATMLVASCSTLTSTYTSAVTVSVSTNPPPTITLGPINQLSCSNFTNSASISISNGTPGYTVTWSPGATLTGSTANTYSVSGLSPGTNTIMVKDALGCIGIATINVKAAAITPTVSITSFPTNILTCAIPTIQLTANGGPPSIAASLTYSWTSACLTSTNPVITVTAPCIYQVIVTDPNTGCTVTASLSVVQDNTVSVAGITPGAQVIQCGVVPNTYTGTPAPQSNYTYQWFLPCGPPLAGYICSPGCAGVYTFEVTNALNGCKSTKTVQVTANSAVPSLTVSAQANNYFVTCVTCVTMQITGFISGGGGLGVRWMDQTMTTTLTTSNTYSTCIAGNYVAYVYDLAAPNCSVAQMVTVLSNTILPNAGFTSITWGPMQNPTLTCNNPCVILTGTSTATSYSVAWNIPAAVTDVTLSVCSTTNQAQTTVSTPSVVITDLVNGCVKKLPVPVYQDIKTVTLTAKSTPSLLTCKVVQSQLQYTPNPLASLHTWTWTTPSPTSYSPQVNPISVNAPGTYTIDATNTVNGCTSTQTVNVGLNNLPPAVTVVPTSTIVCGSPTTQVISGVTSTVGNTYFWKGPNGSGINPLTGGSPSVNKKGVYTVIITNTITGCVNTNTVLVVMGDLNTDFIPDPATGYAPLSVTFSNTTAPAGGNTTWGYGNGTSQTSTTSINGAATYDSPGTYTVILITKNGICIDSAIHTVFVDIPSKLEVPNVFTPNGDGINDNFILHTANLTDITVTIYDRWGLKVYEVTTDKGNISWDGKTLADHPATSGTYFWIVKANGKDGMSYEQKGNVTLFR